MDNEQQQELELKSIGGVLLLARTEAGLSQDDVAQKLFLAKTAIAHIENDEFDKLEQNPVFIRGYVRSYARLVGLDEEEVIKLLDKSGVKQPPMTSKSYMLPRRQASVRDKKFRWLTYAVIVLLIILLFVWWHSHVSENKTTIVPPSIHAHATQAMQSAPPTQPAASQSSATTSMGASVSNDAAQKQNSPTTNNTATVNAKQIKNQLTMDTGK